MELHLVLLLCGRTAWLEASNRLRVLRRYIDSANDELPSNIRLLALYLEGVIFQGTGSLSEALSIFQSTPFSLAHPKRPGPSKHSLEISVLAALNSLLILRSQNPDSPEVLALIDRLSPICADNQNKAIMSAYNLILATARSADTIVRTKQCLQNALQAAKSCGNNQLMCMTLNLMSWKFFKGVVGQQAEKSAKASQSLAFKGQDALWMSVSAGLLSDTLEIQGKTNEADQVRAEAYKVAGTLPEAMQVTATNGVRV